MEPIAIAPCRELDRRQLVAIVGVIEGELGPADPLRSVNLERDVDAAAGRHRRAEYNPDPVLAPLVRRVRRAAGARPPLEDPQRAAEHVVERERAVAVAVEAGAVRGAGAG